MFLNVVWKILWQPVNAINITNKTVPERLMPLIEDKNVNAVNKIEIVTGNFKKQWKIPLTKIVSSDLTFKTNGAT